MTDAETIAWLRAFNDCLLGEMARVTAERDALKSQVEAMEKFIAEIAVTTACEECGEAFSLSRIMAFHTLCEGCQTDADEDEEE